VELVELHNLDGQGVGDMVCAIFDEESVTDEFRDFLHERSEGNPFVLEEMLRDALDRGDIFRSETGWDRKSLVEMRIPRTVKDALLQRLERLAREHVSVLSAAAVVGRSFDLKTLAAVAGVDEAAVLAALEAAVTAQLIEEEDPTSGRYRFRHALTREAVYEDLIVPRRQQLHSKVADILASRADRVAVDLANHLMMAGRYEEAVAMCVAAAEDAVRAVAFGDAAELLERAAPHVKDSVERARLLCRAADAYWNNTESANAKRLLEQGISDLEAAGLHVEAAHHRLLLGRCWWELLRSDLAVEQFEKARDVLEPGGPSEDLALAYMRLGSLLIWNAQLDNALEQLRRAVEIAERAGADLPRVWSLIFLGGVEVGLGHVQAGFAHLDESYHASVAAGYRFQVFNVTYNSLWEALHLGFGDKVATWSARASAAMRLTADAWPFYVKALVGVEQGLVIDAIRDGYSALQRARDAGHSKMVWRASVALARALAEHMQADDAVAMLPPVSSRVDSQDAIYDTAARVRTHLAAGDPAGALADARTVKPQITNLVSPADAVAEVAVDPDELRSFISGLTVLGEVAASPRLAVAQGRLALLERRYGDAVEQLLSADSKFRGGGLLLDAWHLGRALAEAEFHLGDVDTARQRLVGIVGEAEPAGALLAAKLARQTAASLGLEIGAGPEKTEAASGAPRFATGERMVSVLFADVRGYTELAGQSSPADMADRIASLQRWAAQEVARRYGVVDKFAGDAIMATFNVSGQSVDHALAAVRAAIAIIDKAALAGLPVGAGVAVGPAIVGNLAESANLSVLGEATNLAARLQAQSAPGEVTLSEEAHRRVSDWLAAQGIRSDRVELELKGFPELVPAYRVAASTVVVSPA
jgi:class 3 adenylate cyclase/tetratricopeptide (TPR) repeat protein